MSSVQTARDLVAHQDYAVAGGNGATALTRKSCEHQEWVFGATGGHEFMIKFDKNFFKKHLLTYSKKSVEVGSRAKELWEAAGQPSGRDVEFWVQAETEKLYGKLTKSTSARTEAKVCKNCKKFFNVHICSACNHSMNHHMNASGLRKDCAAGGCGCLKTAAVTFACPTGGTSFLASTGDYATSRAAKGKPDANPLAGAQTSKNTCLILDKIPMAEFKTVLIKAIENLETNAFTWPEILPAEKPMPPVPPHFASPATKHVNWDFGATRLGCVIKVDLAQDSSLWVKKQGLIVSMVKTGVADNGRGGKQYQYCAYHFNGEI